MPQNTFLAGAKGAYVNAVALASTAAHYQEVVTAALRELALFPFEFEDVERFCDRSARMQLDESIRGLAEDTRRTGRVTFDEFHIYRAVDG
jgi:hypothetical protein